jgi:AcrR family transcriptional regulator
MPPSPTRLLQRAQAASGLDDVGERILRAAREVFATFGLRRSTMDDVAKRAGLGRATVYRRFASKDLLVETVFLDEMRTYLAEVDAITEQYDTFAEQIVEGFVATLRATREQTLLGRLIELEGDWGLRYVTLLAAPVIAAAREYLAAKIRAAQARGEVPPFDATPAAELIVRTCHSLMLTPQGVIPFDDDDAARRFARDHIVPFIMRAPAPVRD